MTVVPIGLMLATLTDRRDFGEDWLLERKFDGERCIARKVGSEVRLESRAAKDLTGTYPEVRSALARQRQRELMLDGEVVAFDGEQTSFSRLRQRLGVTNPAADRVAANPVVYCVFDLLELDGDDLRDLSLLERRARLTDGLRYAGKVGTGYTAATLRELGARLRQLETSESPFADVRPILKGAHWTRPELVAQIGFAEWTNDGRLRQPRFLGLRDGKPPTDVFRERPR
jgi:ATP-dependent DNA ligase